MLSVQKRGEAPAGVVGFRLDAGDMLPSSEPNLLDIPLPGLLQIPNQSHASLQTMVCGDGRCRSRQQAYHIVQPRLGGACACCARPHAYAHENLLAPALRTIL